MKISTRGRYALRLMLDLAQNDGDKWISLRDVSRRQDISVKYLEQIVASLCKNELVRSTRGPAGGYRLSRAPAEYKLGEILRVIEGPLVPVACLENDPNLCPRAEFCPTLGFWRGLSKTVNDYVDSYTLADLVGEAKASPAEYVI